MTNRVLALMIDEYIVSVEILSLLAEEFFGKQMVDESDSQYLIIEFEDLSGMEKFQSTVDFCYKKRQCSA